VNDFNGLAALLRNFFAPVFRPLRSMSPKGDRAGRFASGREEAKSSKSESNVSLKQNEWFGEPGRKSLKSFWY
jgi:hypothetical protein